MFAGYLRQREKKPEKFLNIKKDSGEKLVFVFSKIFAKKIQFIIADFQTHFTDNKRKLWRENQWKPIILEKVIPFTRNHSFQWKLFRLV